MAQSGLPSSWTWGPGDETAGQRERGGRRKKVYDYLKAANELRQSYAAQWTAQRNAQNAQRDFDDDYYNTPGAFPDIEIARSGDEEMVVFPTYARRVDGNARSAPPGRSDSGSRSEYAAYYGHIDENGNGQPEWEDQEDESTVVDVDVRGWIYSPHRGPMTRKHRLMIALARRLSGIPAPTSVAAGDADEKPGSTEEELVDKEAQKIMGAADRQGGQGSSNDNYNASAPGRLARWTTTQPSTMTKDEISVSNAHLMERLRPFLSNPMAQMPVTVFFFNNDKSQSRNITTDESGHFSLRAALSFIPTHVRVLAAEGLSTVKEVQVIEPAGVSLISDIDDTVKHSAIASGAKEIFRNTFIRELSELAVVGVTEWYQKLADMGVTIHYVSNSPWQMYPLLDRYFKLVGLPPGSFHLKQYSGMLQGIFEPTAERKKGSLERILRDFPERKFILVGDSGEADLEVYTDVVEANPGRILGVFIRDVTTSEQRKFFEKSLEHLDAVSARSRSTGHLADLVDTAEQPPALPPRWPREMPNGGGDENANTLDNADLIDLRDGEEEDVAFPMSNSDGPLRSRQPPVKPSKPSSLRVSTTSSEVSVSNERESPSVQESIRRKPVPAVPSRSSPSGRTDSPSARKSVPPAVGRKPLTPPRNCPSAGSTPETEKMPEGQNAGYLRTVQNAINSASNALPSPADYLPIHTTSSNTDSGVNSPSDSEASSSKRPPPVPPPRRSNTAGSGMNSASTATLSRPSSAKPSHPAGAAGAALQYASERLSWSSSPVSSLKSFGSSATLSRTNTINSSNDQDPSRVYADSGVPPAPLPNKREELWRRRWTRAKDILDRQGVLLASWRVGSDVQDVCSWLVEETLKQMIQHEPGKSVKAKSMH